MQFQSSLARLAAFAFFLLSFSMLVCAAPAAVAAPGAGELAVRDSSLVARTYDYTPQCKAALLDLGGKIKPEVDLLVTCSKTSGCDCAPILAVIVKLLLDFCASIKAQVDLGATVDVTACISIVLNILATIFAGLGACVGLTVALCASLDAAIKAFIEIILGLCASVVVKVTILAQIKSTVVVYVSLLVQLSFNLVLGVCGLP
ncbi:hypothetical protein FS749_002984 [Ceratobasidium sp. UAMH 11750]|nr:hypothetical protein FS749_002984 [Ceratobasidium sp. UAMH 11750]